ncbi:MAG: chorismate-binding protein [Bifidobacteriaceae bacterium]|jgi:phenazine biosynthesis protein phzE|nr:chorismate-binding protein [Bifidobacteriaceae bacterium]
MASFLPPADQPFALIRRGGSAVVEVLTGPVKDVDKTGDIPLEDKPVLAVVPFRQIAERGFDVVDDQAPLRCLIVEQRSRIAVKDLIESLPAGPPPFTAEGFDISDSDYSDQVKQVMSEEIGRGEGANFVLHRSFRGRVDADPREAVLAWMAALLRAEQGAYWTYAVFTDGLAFAGASPERHVTVKSDLVTMNPISGTYRHPPEGPTVPGMLAFLTDTKEVDELFMVVDEELKLMCAACPSGGRMIGPYLKPMSKVTHTEYLLEGLTAADPREVLRQTMFAPTVTGSPMQNACAVIARREKRPRGYYAGVLALFEPSPAGVWDLDAPILIRTAYVDGAGRVAVPAGATLVRHSDPASEVAETRTKAAGVLTAIGALPDAQPGSSPNPHSHDAAGPPPAHPSGPGSPPPPARSKVPTAVTAPAAIPTASPRQFVPPNGPDRRQFPAVNAGPVESVPIAAVAEDPQVRATLLYRNERLAQFWLRPQASGASPLAGLETVVIDAADNFSQMLAHLLRRLGSSVRVESWRTYRPGPEGLVVPGPGPGDPIGDEPRIAKLRHVIGQCLEEGRPFLAVCLSHQILAHHLGLDLRQLARPHQGEQLTDDLFGMSATLGYYNTFTAVAPLEALPNLEVVRRRGADEVIALRGPNFVSLQGHPESALSPDGLSLLSAVLPALLSGATPFPPQR